MRYTKQGFVPELTQGQATQYLVGVQGTELKDRSGYHLLVETEKGGNHMEGGGGGDQSGVGIR
jgi:hypothetical protein